MSNQFSRDEITKIMSKASQIQAQMDKYGDHEMLSEDELLELGDEVGISKSAILQAMNEVNSSENQPKRFSWLKGTSALQETRLLPGTLTEEEWDAVVAEIRASTGGIGKLTKTNSTFEWEQRKAEVGYRHLTFIPGKESTRFIFNYNWQGMSILMSVVPTVLAMSVFVIVGKGLFGTGYKSVAALSGLIAGFVGGRFYLASYFKDQKRKLNDLTKSITGILKRKKSLEPLLHKMSNDEHKNDSNLRINSSKTLEK